MDKSTPLLLLLASVLVPTRASADCFTTEQARAGTFGWVRKATVPTLCLESSSMKPRCLELGDAGQRQVIGKGDPENLDLSSSGRHTMRILPHGGNWLETKIEVCAVADATKCNTVVVDTTLPEHVVWDVTPKGDHLMVHRAGTAASLEAFDVHTNKRLSRHQVTNPVIADAKVVALEGVTFVGNRSTVLRFEPTVATTITGKPTSFRMGWVKASFTSQLLAMITDDGRTLQLLDWRPIERTYALPEVTNGEVPVLHALPHGSDLYLAYEARSKRPAEHPRWDGTVLRIDVDRGVVGRRSLRCE